MELKIKPAFEEKYKKLLADEYDVFSEFIKNIIPKSIRVNTLKIDKAELLERLEQRGWKLRQVPWFDSGFVVEKNTEELTKTLEHYLGYYYIQESSSMIPPIVLEPMKDDVILDMAAAPGSKTTQLAQMMENQGMIIANDVNTERLKSLRGNLQKSGIMNTIVTAMNGLDFLKLNLKFKKILLDAPCSASGKIANSWRIMEEWSEPTVKKLSSLQKKLIVSACHCLTEGGTLVYSTCSLDPEENEEVIDFAVSKLGMTVDNFNVTGLISRGGFTEYKGKKFDESLEKCIRIFPHDNGSGGFFVCRLRK